MFFSGIIGRVEVVVEQEECRGQEAKDGESKTSPIESRVEVFLQYTFLGRINPLAAVDIDLTDRTLLRRGWLVIARLTWSHGGTDLFEPLPTDSVREPHGRGPAPVKLSI
jgi:hypothetical protein